MSRGGHLSPPLIVIVSRSLREYCVSQRQMQKADPAPKSYCVIVYFKNPMPFVVPSLLTIGVDDFCE